MPLDDRPDTAALQKGKNSIRGIYSLFLQMPHIPVWRAVNPFGAL